jgi:hypothetical protein
VLLLQGGSVSCKEKAHPGGYGSAGGCQAGARPGMGHVRWDREEFVVKKYLFRSLVSRCTVSQAVPRVGEPTESGGTG